MARCFFLQITQRKPLTSSKSHFVHSHFLFESIVLRKHLSYCFTWYHLSNNFLLDDWCKSSEFGQCEHIVKNWPWEIKKYLEWIEMDLKINYLIILVCIIYSAYVRNFLMFFFFFNFDVEVNLVKTLSWFCRGTVTNILVNFLKTLQDCCCLLTAAHRLLRFTSINTLGRDLLPYIF